MGRQGLSAPLALLAACAQAPQPATTAALSLPGATSAVSVSSARFLAPDPGRSFSNSELRNCRFGRTDKIPLVPALVEWTPTTLRFQQQELAALTDGALPADLTPLEAAMAAVADNSQQLASGGCHPWRGGPDDLSMVPALLIAAEASLPADGLARLSEAAGRAGLIHQTVWVEAPSPRPVAEQATPAAAHVQLHALREERVADVIAAVSQRRGQGTACVQLGAGGGEPGGQTGTAGSAAAHPLRGEIAVVPLFWSAPGAARMVSGEQCPAPEAPDPGVDPGVLLK